jgi:uncharacterized integral membrane protein
MKGLKVIPAFLFLLGCTYVGTLFVEANREPVTVNFLSWSAGPAALGMVVMTSALAGMAIAGLFCSVEVLMVLWENRRLRRRLAEALPATPTDDESPYRDTGGGAIATTENATSINRYTPL